MKLNPDIYRQAASLLEEEPCMIYSCCAFNKVIGYEDNLYNDFYKNLLNPNSVKLAWFFSMEERTEMGYDYEKQTTARIIALHLTALFLEDEQAELARLE